MADNLVHKMKRKRLVVEYSLDDVTLLGVTSSLRAYKLAWLINQAISIKLVKVQDFQIEWSDQKAMHIASFLSETEHCTFRLIKNRATADHKGSAPYLIQSLRHIDFFFVVQDFTQTFSASACCSAIRATKKIEHIAHLDLYKLKDRANLLFCL